MKLRPICVWRGPSQTASSVFVGLCPQCVRFLLSGKCIKLYQFQKRGSNYTTIQANLTFVHSVKGAGVNILSVRSYLSINLRILLLAFSVIHQAVDNKGKVDMVYLDFKKALDSVPQYPTMSCCTNCGENRCHWKLWCWWWNGRSHVMFD